MRWLLAGLALLGAASLGIFGYTISTASKPLTWQIALVTVAWLIGTSATWHFLHHLPQGELDFDGEHWYFADQAGSISVRFDVQNGMLLRFESEFKRVSWLWIDAGFIPNDWHDLRRAVYSRPAIQNSPDLI